MKHYHFNSVTSTNDIARKLFDKDNIVMITADYQTQGRGRSGKIWYGNQFENVYCSFVFPHKTPPTNEQLIALQGLGCLISYYSLKEIARIDNFLIKYPNDIVYLEKADGKNVFKKICGVLVENNFLGTEILSTIIGIGINVNQIQFEDEIKDIATSLALLNKKTNPFDLIENLKKNFRLLHKLHSNSIFELWEKELKMEERKIALKSYSKVNPQKNIWKMEKLNKDGSLTIRNVFDDISMNIDNGISIEYLE